MAGQEADALGQHLNQNNQDFNTNPWVVDEDSTYMAEQESAAGDPATAPNGDQQLLSDDAAPSGVVASTTDSEAEVPPPEDAGAADAPPSNVESFDAPTTSDPPADMPPATEERKEMYDEEEKFDLDDENPIGPVLAELLDKDIGIPKKVQPDGVDITPFDPEWRYNISIGDVVKRTIRVPNPKKEGEYLHETLWFPKEKSDRKVFCALKVKRVSDVSNVDETFCMRFHIYFNWMITPEEYVSYMEAKTSGDPKKMMEWEPSWYPHIEIQNLVDGDTEWEVYPEEGAFRVQTFKDFGKEKKEKIDDDKYDSTKARFIRAKLEVEGVFAEELELQSFPFDCQDLSCTIHERSSGVHCVFVPELRKPNFASIDPRYSVIDEWDLDTAILEMGDAEGSRTGNAYSMIVIRLKVKRRYMVYMWSIVFLVACITFLSLTSFALAEPDLGPRLGLVITLILTAVAFSYVAFENLPNVPYLTLMDMYILMGYGYLVAVMIESAFLAQIGPDGDIIAFWIFFAIFWIGHIGFGIWSYVLRQDELAKLNFSSDEIDEEVALQRPKIRFDYRKRVRAGRDARLLSFTGTIDTAGMSAKDQEKHQKYKEKLDRLGTTRHQAKASQDAGAYSALGSETAGSAK